MDRRVRFGIKSLLLLMAICAGIFWLARQASGADFFLVLLLLIWVSAPLWATFAFIYWEEIIESARKKRRRQR